MRFLAEYFRAKWFPPTRSQPNRTPTMSMEMAADASTINYSSHSDATFLDFISSNLPSGSLPLHNSTSPVVSILGRPNCSIVYAAEIDPENNASWKS